MNEEEIKRLFPKSTLIETRKSYIAIKPTKKSKTVVAFIKQPLSPTIPRIKAPLLIQTNGNLHVFFRDGHIVKVGRKDLLYFVRNAPKTQSATKQIEKDAKTLYATLMKRSLSTNEKIWLIRYIVSTSQDSTWQKTAMRWLAYKVDKGLWIGYTHPVDVKIPIETALYADPHNLAQLLEETLHRLVLYRVRGKTALLKLINTCSGNISVGISPFSLFISPVAGYLALAVASLKNHDIHVYIPQNIDKTPVVNMPSSVNIPPNLQPVENIGKAENWVINLRRNTAFWKSKEGKNILRHILSTSPQTIYIATSPSMLKVVRPLFDKAGYPPVAKDTKVGLYKAGR